jgi:hypothetical protein
VYAGGAFDSINAGTARHRLAAFDPHTGVVDPAFDPDVDGQVSVLALHAGRLYAGGQFGTVNGATTRNRVASFDTSTGVADPAFDPDFSSQTTGIRALAFDGDRLYAGGFFDAVNGGTPAHGICALDATTGLANPAFSVSGAAPVFAIVAAGSRLYVGGGFAGISNGRQLRFAQFSTPPVVAPTAVSGAASAVTDTGARLAGIVSPNATATNYTFEYGTSTAFGSMTPVSRIGSGAGGGAGVGDARRADAEHDVLLPPGRVEPCRRRVRGGAQLQDGGGRVRGAGGGDATGHGCLGSIRRAARAGQPERFVDGLRVRVRADDEPRGGHDGQRAG